MSEGEGGCCGTHQFPSICPCWALLAVPSSLTDRLWQPSTNSSLLRPLGLLAATSARPHRSLNTRLPEGQLCAHPAFSDLLGCFQLGSGEAQEPLPLTCWAYYPPCFFHKDKLSLARLQVHFQQGLVLPSLIQEGLVFHPQPIHPSGSVVLTLEGDRMSPGGLAETNRWAPPPESDSGRTPRDLHS